MAGKPWHYKVLATGPTGKALSGTVVIEFVFHRTVVGRPTPATHRLKNGRLKDTVIFPLRALGTRMTLRVVVHTSAGTVTLDWLVKARR